MRTPSQWQLHTRPVRAGLLPSADSSRMGGIIAVTYVVGLARRSHVIAGSVEVLYLVSSGVLPATAFVGHYLVPTLLGNTIGGVSLVAAVNHAQVVSGHGTGTQAASD